MGDGTGLGGWEFVEQRRSEPREVGKSVGVGLPGHHFPPTKKIRPIFFLLPPLWGVNICRFFLGGRIYLSFGF